MKPFLSILTLFLACSFSFSQEIQNDTLTQQQQGLSIVIVSIEGMACQEGCADKIGLNLQNTLGVISAAVSYDKKEAQIKFDQNIVSPSELKTVITNTKVKEYIYTINSIIIKE
mgnify:CR=1 FL=1